MIRPKDEIRNRISIELERAEAVRGRVLTNLGCHLKQPFLQKSLVNEFLGVRINVHRMSGALQLAQSLHHLINIVSRLIPVRTEDLAHIVVQSIRQVEP